MTQGFSGKASGWGSQRKHPTQEGAVVIKEGFLEEAWLEHEEHQEECPGQRVPCVQRLEGPTGGLHAPSTRQAFSTLRAFA